MQHLLLTLWWVALPSVMARGRSEHTPISTSPAMAGGQDWSRAGQLSVSGSRRRLPCACGFNNWTGVLLSRSDVVCQRYGRGTLRRFTEGVRGGAVVSDQYNARMQVMITRNMRKVLVEELDYFPDEVDDMDPQIAAVVIEKSLPRPRAGMPIAWRKCIQRKGSASNPVASVFGAAQSMIQAVLNAALTVVTLPLRAFGAAGGAKRKAAQLLAVAAVMLLITSDSERRSDASSTVGALGEKLKTTLKDILPSKSSGDKVNSGNGKKPSKDKENPLSSSKAAVAAAGRWFSGGQSVPSGAETKEKTPSTSPSNGARASEGSGSASASALSQGRQGQRGGDRSRRSSSRRSAVKPPKAKSGTRISDPGQEGGELSLDDDFVEEELSIGETNSRRNKATDTISSSSNQVQGNGRQGQKKSRRKFRDVSPQHADEDEDENDGGKDVAWATPTTSLVPERSTRRRDNTGDATVGERRQRRNAKENTKEKGLARMQTPYSADSEVDEEEEVCPDMPLNPNFNGAVWFEELPPVPPAPGTVGVLEEGETSKDDTSRWGQRPLSEHIPSEDEMAEWESNMTTSDTWLDRRINEVITLFGRGGNTDDSN